MCAITGTTQDIILNCNGISACQFGLFFFLGSLALGPLDCAWRGEESGARRQQVFVGARRGNAGGRRVEKYHEIASQHAKKLDETKSDASRYRQIGRPRPLCSLCRHPKTVVTPTVLDLVRVIDIPCEATNSEDLIIDQRVYCVFWQREKDAHWKNTFDSFRQFFSPLTEQNSNRASSRTDHLRC